MEVILAALSKDDPVGVLDSLYIALIGIAIVFVVLAFLMCILYLVGLIMSKTQGFAEKHPKYAAFVQRTKDAFTPKKKKAQVTEEKTEETAELAKGSCGDLVLVNTSDRDAAMIMAIVADTLETPLNQLHFKSIKLVEEEKK